MKFIYLPVVLLSMCIFFLSCNKENQSSTNQTLWYTYPAKYWNSQALHLGNGYFGASFFGGVEKETFALSEKSMWTGGPANGDWEKAGVNPKAKAAIPAIREAVINGRNKEADSLISHNVFGSSEMYGFFTSVGELKLVFPDHHGKHENYTRTLDLKNSIGTVKYDINGVRYRREYFCSYPNRILAMKLTSDKKEKISFKLAVDIMQDSSVVTIGNNVYEVKGFIDGNQRPFHVMVHLQNEGGVLGSEDGYLTLENANSAVLFLTMATNYEMKYPDYVGAEPELITSKIIDNAIELQYMELKRRHIADYQSLFNRVSFRVNGNDEVETLPTNERFQRLREGNLDPGYKELAFHLGRYMIISSSRPNTLPANLQGVWNAFYVAPWSGNYQSNVNVQEIYWSCGPTNLVECQQSYIDWIENLAISGREIAARVYGTDGWVSHTTGNIWGHAAPIGSHPWGMYPMGAAWHCQHVWDQFMFTGDTSFLLNQAYPILKQASIFWLENLFPYKGYLITAPTVSAEHGALITKNGLNPAYHDFKSDDYIYSLTGVYQDIQMIWDLFSNTSNAAQMAGEADFADSLLQVREKLLPLKIGKHGQLQEWYKDIDHPDCHHRHISHLYAVCPGNQIHPVTTPKLAEAAKKSLNMRGDGRFLEQELASGGNWSRAHRMWCWTRLLDGNRANKILNETLTEQGFENGLTFQHAEYHWERKDFYMEDGMYLHFQLDATASIPGCIAEMLLQSHLNEIHLLPALPDEFQTGKISGIRARGGYTIDMEWKDMKLERATIHADRKDKKPVVRLKEKLVDMDTDQRIHFVTRK